MGTLIASPWSVHYLWRGSWPDHDTHFYEEDNLSDLTSLLNGYVCKGKAWSEMLPAGLMRDAWEEDEEYDEEYDED